MVDPASKFTELNCMRVGSATANAPLPDLGRLEVMGYRVMPIRDARVMNTDTDVNSPDPAWHLVPIGQGIDILLSGTFTYDLPHRYHMNPVGTVLRNGVLEAVGLDRAQYRGSMAILSDGSIVLGRSTGNGEAEIHATFGEGDLRVRDYMGGGAMLVEYGQPVSTHDLREVQGFTSGQGGINATQLQKSDHVVVGVRKGQAFALWAKAKTGREIRSELLDLGFASVVKFAGGSAAFLRDKQGVQAQGVNSVGLGLRLRKW